MAPTSAPYRTVMESPLQVIGCRPDIPSFMFSLVPACWTRWPGIPVLFRPGDYQMPPAASSQSGDEIYLTFAESATF
jgi:hypothetical protein